MAATACVLLFLLTVLSRVFQGSWVAPGTAFAAVWFVAATVPLVIAPSFYVRLSGYVAVLVFASVAVAGSTLGMWVSISRAASSPSEALVRRIDLIYLGGLVACAFLPALVYLSARSSFGIAVPASLARAVTEARYEEGFVLPPALRGLLAILYATACLGGFRFALARTRIGKLVSLAWLLPVVGVVVIMTGRAIILFTVDLWLAGAICGARMSGRTSMFRLKRMAVPLLGAIVIVYVMFSGVRLIRWGGHDAAALEASLDITRVEFGGHMSAFGAWLDARGGHETVALGERTLAGVWDKIGAARREIGVYGDRVEIAPEVTTNVYTAWRALIDDFSVPGAMVAVFISATLAGAAWQWAARGSRVAVPVLLGFLAFTFCPVTSIFAYNSIIGALLLVSVIIVVPVKQKRAHDVGRLES